MTTTSIPKRLTLTAASIPALLGCIAAGITMPAIADTPTSEIVRGSGTNDDPYIAPCDDASADDCAVSSFQTRSLTGLWTNEHVPAYQCPTKHPMLLDKKFSPDGTSLPLGVEVKGLGPIGVSITNPKESTTHFRWFNTPVGGELAVPTTTGTQTQYPNSSATNWNTNTNTYQIILHCTKNQDHAAT